MAVLVSQKRWLDLFPKIAGWIDKTTMHLVWLARPGAVARRAVVSNDVQKSRTDMNSSEDPYSREKRPWLYQVRKSYMFLVTNQAVNGSHSYCKG